MAKFKDKQGDEWAIALDVSYFDRFREVGIDLDAALSSGQGIGELLFGSVRKLGQVAWVMVADQAGERGIAPEQFARRMDGPAVERFGEALVDAMADFSPRSAMAAAIKGQAKTVLAEADAAILKVLSGSPGN